jgi:hypothetical protein
MSSRAPIRSASEFEDEILRDPVDMPSTGGRFTFLHCAFLPLALAASFTETDSHRWLVCRSINWRRVF